VLDRLRNPEPDRDPRLARLTPTDGRIVDKNYVSTILDKLEVARRAKAAAY
jgi:hypothetical protein